MNVRRFITELAAISLIVGIVAIFWILLGWFIGVAIALVASLIFFPEKYWKYPLGAFVLWFFGAIWFFIGIAGFAVWTSRDPYVRWTMFVLGFIALVFSAIPGTKKVIRLFKGGMTK